MPDQDDRPTTLASLLGSSRRTRTPGGARPIPPSLNNPPAPAAQKQMGLFFASAGLAPDPGAPESEAQTPVARTPDAQTPVAAKQAAAEASGKESATILRPEFVSASPFRPSPLSGIEPRPVPLRASGPAAERRIWSVRALVSDVRQHLELGYGDVWVEGELSDCRTAASGHVYLNLKDGEAQLPVVLFRRQASLLRFRPVDGLAVLVRGRISIYEGRGQVQLIAETMEPRGAGALQVAFEQLKARLLAEGLFDAGRKRPLPAFPRCVGIITSTGGAVIRDIITVCRRRHARLNLLIFPAVMQGAACAGSVASGLRWFRENPHLVDLIIIARGGGSLEDLAGFNDESLARAIAASTLPVVSAVGHETDFTIADFVADLRAPTPSAAAEIVTTAQHRIEERVQALERSVLRAGRYHLMLARNRLERLSAAAVLRRLQDTVGRREQRIDDLRLRLDTAAERLLRLRRQRLSALLERLRRQDASHRLLLGRHRLHNAQGCLERAARQLILLRRPRLHHLHGRLEALSPLAVLARGYALVYAPDGTLLRSPGELKMGETIEARLAQGSLLATVTEIRNP